MRQDLPANILDFEVMGKIRELKKKFRAAARPFEEDLAVASCSERRYGLKGRRKLNFRFSGFVDRRRKTRD